MKFKITFLQISLHGRKGKARNRHKGAEKFLDPPLNVAYYRLLLYYCNNVATFMGMHRLSINVPTLLQ